MLNKLITKIAILALHSKRITGESKNKIIEALIKNIGALPVKKIISFDDFGVLHINGRPLESEQAINFQLSVRALADNEARKIFNQQKRFLAIEMGVHNGLTPEMIIFSKACLWDIEQDEILISQILAQ